MKICNATGNGICIGCPGIPPKYHGDLCRKTAQEVIDTLEGGYYVMFNPDDNCFYYKWSPLHAVYDLDEEWEKI